MNSIIQHIPGVCQSSCGALSGCDALITALALEVPPASTMATSAGPALMPGGQEVFLKGVVVNIPLIRGDQLQMQEGSLQLGVHV